MSLDICDISSLLLEDFGESLAIPPLELPPPNIVSDDADHYSLPVNGIRLVNQFFSLV